MPEDTAPTHEFKFSLKDVRAFNYIGEVPEVVHLVNLTLILKDQNKKTIREEMRPVKILEDEDAFVKDAKFIQMPGRNATQTEKDAFAKQAITWAKDTLSKMFVPDPDAQFNTDEIDQLTLWKRTIVEGTTNPLGGNEKRRRDKEHKF